MSNVASKTEIQTETASNGVTWKQAKALIRFGFAKRGLDVSVDFKQEPTQQDIDTAIAEIESWGKDASNPQGMARYMMAARLLTEGGLDRKGASLLLGKKSNRTILNQLGVEPGFLVETAAPKAEVLRPKFQTVSKTEASESEMFFFTQDTPVQTQAKPATSSKAMVRRLLAAGFTLDEALTMVGV